MVECQLGQCQCLHQTVTVVYKVRQGTIQCFLHILIKCKAEGAVHIGKGGASTQLHTMPIY